MAKHELACPKCGQVDMVQKVRAIYESGFSTFEYTQILPPPPNTDWAPLPVKREAVVQSKLSERLAPPPRPKGAPMWLLIVIIPLCWIASLASSLSSDSSVLIVIVGGIVIAIVAYMREQSKKTAAKLPSWENAVRRWNELYYCARDDGVFNPNEGEFMPVSQLWPYLYQ